MLTQGRRRVKAARTLAQGERILISRQDAEEVILVPAGFADAPFDPALAGVFPP